MTRDPDDGYERDQQARWPGRDGYAATDAYSPAGNYQESGDYSPSDGYPPLDQYDPYSGYSAAAVRDAYARDAYARVSGDPAAGGRAPGDYIAGDEYAPEDEGYAQGNGYGAAGTAGGFAAADGYENGGARYGGPDSYQHDHDYGYGDDEPGEYHDQDGYHDEGPFRWQPEDHGGPDDQEDDPGELPGYDHRAGSGPQPHEPDEDDSPGWGDGPSRDGFIPGLRDGRGTRSGVKRRRPGRVLAPLLALALLIAVSTAGYVAYRKIHFGSADFTGPGTGEVTIQVKPGDTATSLAPRLVNAGVVASAASFIAAAKASSNPNGLQPGFFAMHKHMNSALAYKLLLTPSARIQTVVTIPEGMRLTNILSLLQQKLGKTMPPNAFANAIKDTAALGLPSYANGNPEGYLFPATYDIPPGTSALSVLKMMVARFNQEAQTINLTSAAQAGQLTPAQVITVASILEAEGTPQYYSEIAEVIYNRLNQNIDLGLDSTVNYALNRTGPSLTQSQLATNSPYNTFIHPGLPPGPIDSPGDAAIQAALHPDHGDELYFVTVNLQTGQTLFTDNQAQFEQDEALCQQNHAGC